jgi:gliding motility-associated transport system permease protein/gliding motility-associatede transport system auxiliary component
VANFLAANLWLAPVNATRADMTAGARFTLSDATKTELANLQEPLILRGYFTAKTHPLLAPLVPELRDLLSEYAVAGGDRVRVEFVDPSADPEAEQSAADFGIQPVPFQTADRYQSSIVNSYFNLLVSYGDQYQTLGFRDLIEVKDRGAEAPDVVLKNPEYAITRAIRKVTQAYQSGGNVFAALKGPVTFHGYVSPTEALPEDLQSLRKDLDDILAEMTAKSDGKLEVKFEDPAAGGKALADQLGQSYGLRPMVASLTDPKPFWFSLLIQSGDQMVPVALPAKADKAGMQHSIDAALQRFAPGFLHTIALVKPAADSGNPYLPPSGPQFQALEQGLSENATVVDTDLKDGQVPEAADLLMVLAPKELDDTQRFAIDQFLMRGGSVVLATSPFGVSLQQTISAEKQDSGLADWLQGYGIGIDDKLVLDPQNAALPIPVQRNVGGIPMRQIQMMPYPQFPDLRGPELNPDSPVTASLGQLTLNWPSPISVDTAKAGNLQVTTLLTSSDQSWTSDKPDVVPDYRTYPDTGFAVEGKRGAQVLAVAVTGRFTSFYAGKESPLLTAPVPAKADGSGQPPGAGDTAGNPPAEATKPPVTDVIDHSPDSARLVVIGSNDFGSDVALQLASEGLGTRYTKPVDFLQNVVDWSLEDQGLLGLRGRSQFASTLVPESAGAERVWEYLNYGLALAGLALIWGWRQWIAQRDRTRHAQILQEV